MPSGSTESGKEIVAAGPTIMNERIVPKTVELNRKFQPDQPVEVLADIKDFRSGITQVKLKFLHVPLEIPMEKIGGTTWRARFTTKQLQELAVSGQTIRYEANIVAMNEKGQTTMSSSPITVAIKTPDVAKSAA